jgi:ParB/RepB/Spo0J family partition protein
MSVSFDPQVRMIPIAQINVLNPRDRGKKKFGQITNNIANLGLKKPITVATAESKAGEPRYDLVCGQGRLEAYQVLGEVEIPAILVAGTREELLLMSLAENLARRRHSTVELVRDVRVLKARGYTLSEIAQKTDLVSSYIRAILQLLDRGEERLLRAVEKEQLPVNVAITIATSDDKAVQRALQEAYERNDLRGKSLLRARRLIESRRTKGRVCTPFIPAGDGATEDGGSEGQDLRDTVVVRRLGCASVVPRRPFRHPPAGRGPRKSAPIPRRSGHSRWSSSMTTPVRLACRPEVMELPLDRILPTHRLDDAVKKTVKYRCIEASVRELGIIEPLVVFPETQADGKYLLLDGHVRLMILMAQGIATAKCLVAVDDEGFTYNHKVNRLSAIQEHFMILRATKNGVSEERIALSLNVDVAKIRSKRELLDGICGEAVQLLRDKQASGAGLREMRKVKPMRQIEIAELMCAAGNFSVGYVKCLVATTPVEQLVDPERGKEVRGLTPEDVARMEHEMESQGRDFKLIEETHGRNVLHLVLVVGFLRKLTENTRVVKYLTQNYAEIQTEFQKLVETKSLAEFAAGDLAREKAVARETV